MLLAMVGGDFCPESGPSLAVTGQHACEAGKRFKKSIRRITDACQFIHTAHH
jgi:hypothetical protein